MSSKSLIEQIQDIFVQMQDQFKTVEKRLPISLIDALAITNRGHSDLMGLLQNHIKQIKDIRPMPTIEMTEPYISSANAIRLISKIRDWEIFADKILVLIGETDIISSQTKGKR